MSNLSASAQNFGWLLNSFADSTADVRSAIAVSADGILLASSEDLERSQAEQFAAITSGLSSLTQGASRCFDADGVDQVIVEMGSAYMFVTTVSMGSCIGVIADKECDMGLIAYEMTLLVDRFGDLLTPELIAELKNLVAV
ncbi:MAG: roadblock/LC7 domain-containing protein [Acidimicrobiales bacterium]|nr:roadblock/LC7 domain-containing protein [Acidimicrobiales bacterium]